ncbi:MAG: TIGR04255 family protein [Gammaproteobacteria bacterium]
MHQKLATSPITYVLAQVIFTNIESISDYIPRLQDKIRELFPHFQTMNSQIIPLINGQQVMPSSNIQWHFIDKNKHTGIILDGRSITIHTSLYSNFEMLLDKFCQILKWGNEILKFGLITRTGLRYINFIANDLDKIEQHILGFKLNVDEDKDTLVPDKFLTKTETVQLSHCGVIKIQATHISDKASIAEIRNTFITPELIDGASMLSFEHYKEPEKDFLLLDIDHFNDHQFEFDVEKIRNNFKQLQEVIYQVFCRAVGNNILAYWSK